MNIIKIISVIGEINGNKYTLCVNSNGLLIMICENCSFKNYMYSKEFEKIYNESFECELIIEDFNLTIIKQELL